MPLRRNGMNWILRAHGGQFQEIGMNHEASTRPQLDITTKEEATIHTRQVQPVLT